jgi:hypothetical protein
MFTEFTVSLIFRWILTVLVVYRFAHALSRETGPWAIFEKIREWADKTWSKEISAGVTVQSWQSEFFGCPLCQSFWISILFDLIFWYGLPWQDFLLVWFSVSGAIVILHMSLYRR